MPSTVRQSSDPDARPESLVASFVAHPRDGRLPALLLGLTVVTGIVDAVSILALGRVFVANMTGNIVFVGFALARAPGFSLTASLIALLGFVCGAAFGGSLIRRIDRSNLFGRVVAIEAALFIGALLVAAAAGQPLPGSAQDAMAGLLAVALGMQNAMVRRLAVSDLTTTVLTMALTGVAADPLGADGQARMRRLLSIVAMLLGSVTGAALVLHEQIVTALAIAVALLVIVASGGRARRSKPDHR